MWALLLLLTSGLVFASTETGVLILARGGSKGVRLKNIQRIGGVSLLCRAIHTARAAGLHDITVSTDHPLIALEATKCNASLFHRSRVTASDWAPSIWGAQEFLLHRSDISILVLLQATSPFIRVEQLRIALRKLNSTPAFDCIFSVKSCFRLRWRNLNSRIIYPVNFNVNDRPRRQDWNGELLETGAFYITRRHLIIEGQFQNNNCTVLEVSVTDSLEVDSLYDLQVANALLNANMMSNAETITIEDLEATDVVSVELVPERKGLILKHCEYYVSSRRHGTTVTRRYNEFVQLYDILYAKYPYRAVCRLPPKRVVVGGGSPHFLQRRRAALQRWLTLVARHPVVAHDADLRAFLCEVIVKLDKPKHDEFVLAGTQEDSPEEMSTEEMQAAFVSEQEQLRLVHLGLSRLSQIFEKVEGRCEAEKADFRELGAGLQALAAPAAAVAPSVCLALASAAQVAIQSGEESVVVCEGDVEGERVSLALEALGACRELCARLTRGLHAERAAAAAAHRSPAAHALRHRHRYALRCALQEAMLGRAYAAWALAALPAAVSARGAAHARLSAAWARLHTSLANARTSPQTAHRFF